MKPYFSFVSVLLLGLCLSNLHGQETSTIVPSGGIEARITGGISDGTVPTTIPPTPEKPDFRIESTQIKLLEVVESPPMPGLPPVEGTITLKVHSVADPGLPDPPSPMPLRSVDDPRVKQRIAEMSSKYRENRIAFISATVHDRSHTLLTCYPNGRVDQSVTAWSNVDFNHFVGLGSFEATGGNGEIRKYSLLIGIGNQDNERQRKLLATKGIDSSGPEIPTLPEGIPAFEIETEHPDPGTVTFIEDLHALYRDEGSRMAAVYAAREQAREDQKAHLLANPPKPKDVTVHFWKRQHASTNNQNEGGQP